MAVFILIHGAWHGGWCWERVAPLLRARGFQALTPDLPGMSDERTRFGPNTMEEWVSWGAQLVRAQREPVILVGHSAGGNVVSRIAESTPERVLKVIYISGALLRDGQSQKDAGFGSKEVIAATRFSEDGTTFTLNTSLAPSLLYTHLAPELGAALASRLIRQPVQPAIVPGLLTANRFGQVPRTYIECTEDRSVPLAQQRQMTQNWPCTVLSLPSDHVPLYSMPEPLVQALLHTI